MITNNNRRYVSCENSIFYREICATYPTDFQGIGDLSVALALEQGNEKYLLFVDKTLLDVENIVSQAIVSSEAKSQEYLFSSATCDVYLIDL